MKVHKTLLKDVSCRSVEYPVALRDAASLLIEEQENFVPVYMPGVVMNMLEASVMAAKEKSEVEGFIGAIKGRRVIEAFKRDMYSMVLHMTKDYGSVYASGVLFSGDMISPNPAITKPDDHRFSFKFEPKTFDLGLTGRLLEDGTNRYQESLSLECDIYDAYDLAIELHPKRIIAVNNHDNGIIVYEDYKEKGEKEKIEKLKERAVYVFSEDQITKWRSENVQILPTNGLKVVFSDFCEKIRKYDGKAMLFGHKYSSAKEFLERVRILDQHLIWDICAYNRGSAEFDGFDASLIDCEKVYGLKNDVREMPENKNRLQLVEHREGLHLGSTSLYFDTATAIQAIMSLGDIVTDIWFEPVDRDFRKGWDIVYDKRRNITPDKPVKVISNADAERYYTLKDYKSRQSK